MKFDTETAWQFKEATKETPDHPRNVWLVFILSLGSGLTVMFGYWLIAVGAGWDRKGALVAGGLAVLGVWAWWLLKSEELLWTVETVVGHDLDRDGSIGEPSVSYDIPLSKTERIMGDLSVRDTVLIDWCQTAINGGSLSYGAWEQRFALRDGTGGRERYAAFRKQLTGRNLAREVGGNVGLKLTRQGWLFASAMAEADEPTPLLEGPDDADLR